MGIKMYYRNILLNIECVSKETKRSVNKNKYFQIQIQAYWELNMQ